jgi:hypothetical protein
MILLVPTGSAVVSTVVVVPPPEDVAAGVTVLLVDVTDPAELLAVTVQV